MQFGIDWDFYPKKRGKPIVSVKGHLAVLRKTLARLADCQDEEASVIVIIEAVSELLGGADRSTWVGLRTEDPRSLRFVYAYGEDDEFIGQTASIDNKLEIDGQQIGGLEQRALSSGQPSAGSRALGLEDERHVPRGSQVTFPLIRAGHSIGVFTITSAYAGVFDAKTVEGILPFAALMAHVLNPLYRTPDDDLSRFIRRSRHRDVLVLGKDHGEELERLNEICWLLRLLGYRPKLVKREPEIEELSNEEKVRVMADAARFVVLENSHAAGQIAEIKICATNRILTATLREKDKGSSYMVTDYFKDFDFMEEFEYMGPIEAVFPTNSGLVSLPEAVKAATQWAEKKIKERRDYYNRLYPWRSGRSAYGE